MLTIVKSSVRVSVLHQNVFSLHNLMRVGRITRQHDELGPPIVRTVIHIFMETFK